MISDETVQANVRRLRTAQNLGYAQLSRRLKTTGRAIPELGLRRIEEGNRRVDADDLMALAVALGVSPTTLLMPQTIDAHETVTVAASTVTAEQLWRWLVAEAPLTEDTPANAFVSFISRSVPNWLVELIESGTKPNRTYSMLRRGQLREMGSAENGED